MAVPRQFWMKARGNPLTCVIWFGALAMLLAVEAFTVVIFNRSALVMSTREAQSAAQRSAQQQLSIVSEIREFKSKAETLFTNGFAQPNPEALQAAVAAYVPTGRDGNYLGPFLFELADTGVEVAPKNSPLEPSGKKAIAKAKAAGNINDGNVYDIFNSASISGDQTTRTTTTLAGRLNSDDVLISELGQANAGSDGTTPIPMVAAAKRLQSGGKNFAIVVGLDLTSKCKELEGSDCLAFVENRTADLVYSTVGETSSDLVYEKIPPTVDAASAARYGPLWCVADLRQKAWQNEKWRSSIESKGFFYGDDRVISKKPLYRQTSPINFETEQSLGRPNPKLPNDPNVLLTINPGNIELRATSQQALAAMQGNLEKAFPHQSFAWDSDSQTMANSYYLYALPIVFDAEKTEVHPATPDTTNYKNGCSINIWQAIPIGEIENEVAASLGGIRLIGIGVAILFAVAAIILGLLITRPIRQLRNTARRYSELVSSNRSSAAGEALALLPGRTWCEIRSVSDALKQLIQKVEEQQTNLEHKVEEATSDLRSKTCELERQTHELEIKRDELEDNKRLRELFLHQVNHDLRNPLMAVAGYAEELSDSKLDEDQRESVQRILAAASRIQRMVDDIRDYQSIIQGKALPKLGQVDLRELLEQLKMDVRTRVRENHVDLQTTIAENVPVLYSDRDWISRIVGNLLSNACKFTRNGQVRCSVAVEQHESGDVVVIEVQDEGRGLSPAEQEKLFRPYEKILGRAENPDGTGLGLVISRGFCEALYGTVEVDPQRTALGKGATFVVRMPVLYPGERPARLAASASRAPGPLSNLALVIDDDLDVCRLLSTFLKHHDFDVIEAHDGQAGLEMAIERHPGVITLDAQLPKLDGWRVLKELKENPRTANIPVVMVTIFNNPSRGFALGADDYVNKPIDWRYFEQVIERYRSRAARILVVDDDESCRQLVSKQLQHRNWEVAEAGDGAQGLEALKKSRPDLILLDLLMPEVDGFEFLRRMRLEPAWSDIPVVILSGKHLTQEDLNQFNGVVEQVLQKGTVAWDQLRDVISQLLSLQTKHPAADKADKEVHDAHAIGR